MVSKLRPAMLCMPLVLSLGLSACGGSEAASREAKEASGSAGPAAGDSAEDQDSPIGSTAALAAAGANLSEGPDVCFRAIAKHLGPDAKVSEITSFFSVGSEIDNSSTQPAGQMTSCSVQYQNPADPRKLLSTQLDIASGTFGEPRPVEITVAGGNAAEFNLEDYLIPLSKINAASLNSVMDGLKPKLGSVYSRYAWSGVRLSDPDGFNNTHTLRLDLTGRLAANDIKENGYASVTTDGKTVVRNHLMP